ncbi:MAG: hypothetical protein CMC08_09980 [Flavobacteriaceae bacterium]|nr:hypothetical protein [Flavobacteriaceae bacterium]
MCHNFCLIILFFATVTGFGQGRVDGFFLDTGSATIAVGSGLEKTDTYFIGSEESELSRNLFYTNVFVAYGIAANVQASVSLPYIDTGGNENFQDISFFLKYKLLAKQTGHGIFSLATAVGVSTPASNYDLGGLFDIGQQATAFQGLLMLHYQIPNGWFGTLQSGYSIKSNPTPNGVPIVAKVGRARNKWYFDVYYEYQNSFGGIDYRGTPAPQDFREIGVDYHKVGNTGYYSVNSTVGVYLSFSYLLSGRNVFAGPGFGGGIVTNF